MTFSVAIFSIRTVLFASNYFASSVFYGNMKIDDFYFYRLQFGHDEKKMKIYSFSCFLFFLILVNMNYNIIGEWLE